MESQEIKTALDSIKSEVESFIKDTTDTVKESEKMTSEQHEKMAELEERLLEVEQKATANIESEESVKSVGEQLVKSEMFEQFKSGAARAISLEVKNTVQTGNLIVPEHIGLVANSRRALKVVDVISGGTTSSNSIEYIKETFTNNAAEVAEAAAAAQSDMVFTPASAPVRKVNHIINVTTEMVEDAPALVSFINNSMAYGVENKVDFALLNGNGTGVNLSGLMNTGNHTVFTPVAGDTAIDNIRKAITAVQNAEYAADAVILNPADVESLDLAKDTTNAYLSTDPRTNFGSTIWGLPIVVTTAMPAGQFLVGSFAMAAQWFEKKSTVVEMFYENNNNAETGLVTIKAEKRLALAVYRPASLVGGAIV